MSRRMLVVPAMALLIAAPTAASAPSPTASDLNTYLGRMKPLVAAFQRVDFRLSTESNKPRDLRRLVRECRPTRARMAAVRAPSGLREAHKGFVKGLQLYAAGMDGGADMMLAGDPFGGIGRVFEAVTRARILVRRWRQEVIAALRRAGLAVPPWVKELKTPPPGS